MDSKWIYDILESDLKITQTTSLELNWFCDKLNFDLKNTCCNLLDSDLFYYNQAGMLLKKSRNLLELYVKQ